MAGAWGEKELDLWVECEVERRARVLGSRLRNPISSAGEVEEPTLCFLFWESQAIRN